MRIGEINKDNYTDYMKLFGAKNAKKLDEMWDKDNTPAKQLIPQTAVLKNGLIHMPTRAWT